VQLALAYLAQEASLIQTQHKPLATPNPGAEADGATTKGSCPGPEAADVSRWTRLAQVLLAANEMMYLD
jgi:hypothetical protein